MKIFVINLKSSVLRRKTMEGQLNKLGLPFEIFEAVQGSEVTDQEIATYFNMDFYNKRPDIYSPGMVGCTLSHYFLYKKIVEENIGVALILEDDMILHEDFPNLLQRLSTEIRNNEVIMLFYQSYSFPINVSQSSKLSLTYKFDLYQIISTNGVRSTAGYLINQATAKSMAEGLAPISTFPDDWEVFYKKKLLNGIRLVYPHALNNTYQRTTINPYSKGGNFIKKILHFVEKNKIFPFYQLIRYRRMMNIAKSKQCFIINEHPIDQREN